ncbi:PorT family protein [Mucilaginibacter sp. 14171R-50]|uniref:porin family protein n=1 Tax=Mucilaginibacter sp. 14171R-50 TaxID=2703789 RepID=UPI00138DB745|nr:porin family protein [Mucilaginibacter sp. 14171R-50]QHS57697.1 PorT family protein [Mucilaginibacter sp. 14171R-50]
MKKFLLFICCGFAASTAFAQAPSFGIRGGVNFAKLSASDGNITATSNSTTTFAAGVFADFKFGSVSLQPALNYMGKGGEGDDGNGGVTKIKTYYLQVPVNVVYHIPATFGQVYFGAGPYVGYGLSGKVTSTGLNVNADVTFGDGPDDIKRTDFGLDGIAGFEFSNGFILGVNYDLGLSNVTNESSFSTKNRVFGVSVGFKF